jgi:hypothetical protein
MGHTHTCKPYYAYERGILLLGKGPLELEIVDVFDHELSKLQVARFRARSSCKQIMRLQCDLVDFAGIPIIPQDPH